MSLLLSPQAHAQVPNGGNIPAYTGQFPASGTTFTLMGAASTLYQTGNSDYLLYIPTGNFTLNGAAGGTMVTMNNGGTNYGGFYYGGGNNTTLNLNNVTLTGGNNTAWGAGSWAGGGAIASLYMNNGATFTINATNTVAMNGNRTINNGGAIFVNQILQINGSFTANGNTAANGNGGAIDAQNGFRETGSLTANNNTATNGSGGAVYVASGGVSIGGSLTANTNTATGSGGAVYVGSGGVSIGGSLTANTNTASNSGGAVYVGGGNMTVSGSVAMNGNTSSSGNGGAIAVAAGNVTLGQNAGSTVSLTNNKENGGSGGAIYAAGSGIVTIGNTTGAVTISNNSAYVSASIGGAGGAIYSVGATAITGSTITIDGNKSLYDGGAIYSGGTTGFSSSSVSLTNNHSDYSGGAVYSAQAVTVAGNLTANSNTTLHFDGGAFDVNAGGMSVSGTLSADANKSGSNGGFANIVAGNFSASGSVSLTNNQAGTYATNQNNGGAINVLNGNVTLATAFGSTVSIQGNKATNNGGAINATGAVTIGVVTGAVDIGGTTGNTATGTGGAINATGAVSVSGLTITLANNTATLYGGGAISSGDTTTFTTPMLTVHDNTANQDGGAVYSAKKVTVNGSLTADNNHATKFNGGAFFVGAGGMQVAGNLNASGNEAGLNGGVIYAATGDVVVSGSIDASSNITRSAAAGGSGDGNGGVIAALSGDIYLGTGVGATVSLTNNTADNVGGALYADNINGTGGNVTIGLLPGIITSDITLQNNTATKSSGGAIYASNDVNVTTSAAIIIDGNKADTAGNGAGSGGAVYSGGVITLDASDIQLTNNHADNNGGALFSMLGYQITGPITATNNTALKGNGGAIDAQVGGITFSKDIVAHDNAAGLNGGAVYAGAGDINAANINVTVHDNNAGTSGAGDGGAIAAMGGSVTIATASGTIADIHDNSAVTSGGAVYSGQGIIPVPGAVYFVKIGNSATALNMYNNSASAAGGATYSAGTTDFTGSQVTLTNNNADLDGGVVESFDKVTVTGPLTATGNQAGFNGGVFSVHNGGVSISSNGGDVSLTGNTAGYNGGAVYALGTTGSVVIGSANATVTISDNTATTFSGGGVYSTVAVNVFGDTITTANNTAGVVGGAIRSTQDVVLTGTASVTGTGNLAGSSGGVISSAASVTVQAPIVSYTGNTAGFDGGAVAADGDVALGVPTGILTLTDDHAGHNGGAVYGGGVTTLTGANVVIQNNTASHDGGAVYSGGNLSVGTVDGVTTVTDNSAENDGGALFGGGAATTLIGKTVNLYNNTATGSGGAVHAVNEFQLIVADDTTIHNNTAGTNGGAFWVGTDLDLSATTGNLTFFQNRDGNAANAIYLDNTNGAGVATLNTEAGRNITFFDPIASNPDNGIVAINKTGPGLLSFDGIRYTSPADQWSTVYANTHVSAGTFEVANYAVYGSLAADAPNATATSPATSFTSDAGTMVWGGKVGTIRADDFSLNGDMSIAGRHDPITDWSVFHIYSNNARFGEGTIYFNTYLNDGAPDHQRTDLLVLHLNGSNASGHAYLDVRNIDGPGDWTLNYNGIMLVQTINGYTPGPASPQVSAVNPAADTFTLSHRVASGAYEYFLYRGGLDGDPDNANNWYLRNTYTVNDPNRRDVLAIRPEVPTASAVLPLAIQYGYTMLDSLQTRVGETWHAPNDPVYEDRSVWCKGKNHHNPDAVIDPENRFKCIVRVPLARNGVDETRWARSGWARLIGDHGIHDRDNYERRGADYNYNFGGIQAGLDIYARQQADGTLDKAGAYVGYGQINSDVFGRPGSYYGHKAGSVDVDGYTLGAYWTHFSPQGWYTDAVVQGTWYTNTRSKSVLNEGTSPDGYGLLGSLEGGYEFKLGHGWTLTPQAQIVYQTVSFDHSRDSFGWFYFNDGESLRGRLGARLAKTWNMADAAHPRLITGWIRANVWREFMGNTKLVATTLSGNSPYVMPSSLAGTWGEIEGGLTAQVSDKVNLFASGAYRQSLDNAGYQSWGARVGATLRW